jgi:hypothetical protein
MAPGDQKKPLVAVWVVEVVPGLIPEFSVAVFSYWSAPKPDEMGNCLFVPQCQEQYLLRKTCSSSVESCGTFERTQITIADSRSRSQR